MKLFDTSALTGYGIESMFFAVVDEINAGRQKIIQ